MQTEAVFENIADRILLEIKNAQKSIFIAVAWFTNKNIFNALLKKHDDGCSIFIIISNDHINLNSEIDFQQLNYGKSKVFKIGDGNTELMHNKFCVIDYSTVISGSYNYSYKAENNFENVIITYNDTLLAEQFIAEFKNICKQYHFNIEMEEIVFPINKIITRLEIIKNYIILDDVLELNSEVSKLKVYDFNSNIFEILEFLNEREYAKAVLSIQDFISKNLQLSIWIDPEIAALKLEISNLENQVSAFENEKIELEKILAEFQYRHTSELGEIILNILKLQKVKYLDNKEKYKEAEQEESKYRNYFEKEKEKVIFDLSDEQRIEIKKKFRAATFLCHPDKFSEEFKEEASRIFIQLKQAYDNNDLKKITEILEDLQKGNLFKSKSDNGFEKVKLLELITKLKQKIKVIKLEIISIKESDTYQTIDSIEDWNEYFNNLKEKLLFELEELNK